MKETVSLMLVCVGVECPQQLLFDRSEKNLKNHRRYKNIFAKNTVR